MIIVHFIFHWLDSLSQKKTCDYAFLHIISGVTGEFCFQNHTVDGRNPANQLIYGESTSIYKVLASSQVVSRISEPSTVLSPIFRPHHDSSCRPCKVAWSNSSWNEKRLWRSCRTGGFMTPTEGSNLFALEKVTCINLYPWKKKNSKFTAEKMGDFGIVVLSFLGWLIFRGYVSFRECNPPPKGEDRLPVPSFFQGRVFKLRGSMFLFKKICWDQGDISWTCHSWNIVSEHLYRSLLFLFLLRFPMLLARRYLKLLSKNCVECGITLTWRKEDNAKAWKV